MNQRTVNFFSEETRMEGDLFLPSDLKANERRPGVVLCHGFTGVRSLILGDYAKIFAEAGFVALTFDYRGYGGSEGIRRRLIPMEQIDDIRNTISFLETVPEVDPDRIGLWGTSFGGANAPYTAAVDTRIKAVVGQVGFGDGARFLLDTRRFDDRADLLKQVEEDRRRRAVEGTGTRLSPLDALNSAQTNAFLGASLKNVAPSRIDISWETIEKTLEYKPIEVIDRIAPRALLLIGARDDDLCKIEGYEKLYDRAREPKKLVVLPITHYEIYGGKWLEESSRLAVEWFNRFLK
jgi:fermentation-respiration switch protein FrsA (DUF1100 family)